MHIVGAFFIESMDLRQVPGPSTRIDLTGVHFSLAAPSPVPVTLEPHLLVLVHCPEDASGSGALEVTYQRDGEQIARNVQPLQVEPGKFNYRLVRAELDLRVLRHGRGPLPHRLRRRDRGAVHPPAPGRLTCPSPPPSRSTRSPRRRPARRSGQILEAVTPEPDLAVLFATTPMTGALEDVVGAVHAVLRPRTLIGATAVSLLARGQEVEDTTALSLWAGHDRTGGAGAARGASTVPEGPVPRRPAGGHHAGLHAPAPGRPVLVPGRRPRWPTLARRRRDRHRRARVGGSRPGRQPPRPRRPPLRRRCRRRAGAARAHRRAARLARAAGPLGEPMIVTRAERNIVYELAGKPALERVVDLAAAASPEDRALLQAGLHIGVVVDEAKDSFERGDFLVRGVLGADRSNGAMAIGQDVEVGTTIQFHVRDADSPTRTCGRMLGAAGEADGAARVLVQRPWHAPVRPAAPRRRAGLGDHRRPLRGHVLRRRDRSDRPPQLPAQLHRVGRPLPLRPRRLRVGYDWT